MVRKLIRSAFESAAELYGLPNDSEILVQPRRRRGLNRLERIPEIVSRFAAEWDEYDRDIPEAEAPANAKKPAKRRKKPKNPRKKDS
jgi:hypothetical protein